MTRIAALVGLIGYVVVLPLGGEAVAASKCSGDKIKAAGKKAAGELTCHARAVTKGVGVDSECLAKAEEKFASTFAKADAKTYGDDGCLTTGDAITVGTSVEQFVSAAASGLAGGPSTGCQLPASGQTNCYNVAGTQVACGGTGHDGDAQAGATLAYVDNGDGTITDENTGLMWAKKSDDGSIHDQDFVYAWGNSFLLYVAALNGANFAGHNDWRMPNVKELQSIVDYGENIPAASTAFNSGCTPGCNVVSCSCTYNGAYWTATTYVAGAYAWFVNHKYGYVDADPKTTAYSARAVRGGS